MPVSRLASCAAEIDAARETGDDRQSGAAELRREQACELAARRRGLPRPDDREGGACQERDVAFDIEKRRGRVEMGERLRISGLDREERLGADAARVRKLGLGRRLAAELRRPAAPAAAREIGQRVEGHARTAEVIDQLAKGDGADILRADEAQAGDALRLVEDRDRQRGRRERGFVRLTLSHRSWAPRPSRDGRCWRDASTGAGRSARRRAAPPGDRQAQ